MPDIFSQVDKLPCFTKQNLKLAFSGSSFALDERIKRALKSNTIKQLKKGLYVATKFYLQEIDKTGFSEFIATKLCTPAYISLEYVLAKYGLLTEAVYPVTSITLKSTRKYRNFLGSYQYFTIKKSLFFGFDPVCFSKNQYFIANKSKALFDWFYLKKNIGNLKDEITSGLRLNWENFSFLDFQLFKKYVAISESKKLARIAKIIEKYLYKV